MDHNNVYCPICKETYIRWVYSIKFKVIAVYCFDCDDINIVEDEYEG